MPAHSYAFADTLAMSQGRATSSDVAAILLDNIPGALSVSAAHKANDRHGTDWWVEMPHGRHISIDTKVRKVDWLPLGEDDVALESWSVVEKRVIGWTRDEQKRTDYVLWLWIDTGRWLLVPFHLLCAVFLRHWEEWRAVYKWKHQHTPRGGGGYHSECIFVPRLVMWRAIYQQFGGVPGRSA